MVSERSVASMFGRLIIANSAVWAATMLAAAVVAKATDEFIYLLLTLLAGSSLSAWAIGAARRYVQREAKESARPAVNQQVPSATK